MDESIIQKWAKRNQELLTIIGVTLAIGTIVLSNGSESGSAQFLAFSSLSLSFFLWYNLDNGPINPKNFSNEIQGKKKVVVFSQAVTINVLLIFMNIAVFFFWVARFGEIADDLVYAPVMFYIALNIGYLMKKFRDIEKGAYKKKGLLIFFLVLWATALVVLILNAILDWGILKTLGNILT
jgi:hypothetical protein